jgi:DNA invertase Pin-like site-specific DNA recombinase
MGRSPEPGSAAGDKLRRALADSRDDAVREAAAAGLSIARIQQIIGLASTTIMRILNKQPGRGRTP